MSDSIDDITIGQLKLILSAAELGSFTLAGNAVGLSPAAVSKAIKRSEQRLGASLFVRSTRHVRLTDAGERYIAQCREALSLIELAERQVTDEQASPSGRVRLSLPTPYAHWRLSPKLPAFFKRYPDIALNLHISDHSVDLTGERFDLAIRGHELADSGMIARKLEDAELVIVASPDYLAQAPTLITPDGLGAHQCIQFRLPGSGRMSAWSIKDQGVVREFMTTGHLVCEEDYLGGLALARAGAGIYQMYRFAVSEDLASGRLVELLPAYGGATRPFYIIYPDSAAPPARLRVLIDFLTSEVAGRSASR